MKATKKGTAAASMVAKIKPASSGIHRTGKPVSSAPPSPKSFTKAKLRVPVVNSGGGARAVAGRPGVAKGLSVTIKAPIIKPFKKKPFQK